MDKLADIKYIWRDRFSDSRQWMAEVFSRVYRSDEALAIDVDGHVVSFLLLRWLMMTFLGRKMQIGYVYGAVTARQEQSKGYMTRLMVDALHEAYQRGDAIVALLPVRRRLYGFFAKFNFSTVFFIDQQRYTAAHRFEYPEDNYIVDDTVTEIDELATAYERLSASRPSSVCHDAEDLKTILIDNELDRGLVAVVRSAESGSICAIAIAVPNATTMAVRELVSDSPEAETAALASLSRRAPGLMTVIEAYPERPGVRYSARGMARIVNVEKFLDELALIRPNLKQTIRVSDPIIAENNGTFMIAGGKVTRNGDKALLPDLDVDIDVLTSIAFSSEKIGDIFNLPTARPYISLVLS